MCVLCRYAQTPALGDIFDSFQPLHTPEQNVCTYTHILIVCQICMYVHMHHVYITTMSNVHIYIYACINSGICCLIMFSRSTRGQSRAKSPSVSRWYVCTCTLPCVRVFAFAHVCAHACKLSCGGYACVHACVCMYACNLCIHTHEHLQLMCVCGWLLICMHWYA